MQPSFGAPYLAAALVLGGLAAVACAGADDSTPSAASAGGGGGAAPSGGAGSSTGGSGGSVPAVCVTLADNLCTVLDECASVLIRLYYGDRDLCAVRQQMACALELASPDTSRTPAAVANCAKALDGASCDGVLTLIAEACPIEPGARADGEPCFTHSQCASTYCPATMPPSVCGVCTPRSAVGGMCNADPASCPAGTTCAAALCKPFAGVGESCAGGEPCDLGLVCADGLCAIGAAASAPCDDAHPCDASKALSCGADAVCVEPVYAAPYEPCPAGVLCTASSACGASGVCVPPAEDGTACGGAPALGCYGPAACLEGFCSLPDPAACDAAP